MRSRGPLIGYIKKLRADRPRDVVSVFIPEYVVSKWWEQLLHNQSALRLKGRLLFVPGVMVTSVPWLLDAEAAKKRRPIHPDGPAAPSRTGSHEDVAPAAPATRRSDQDITIPSA